jgi:hypothetical protein
VSGFESRGLVVQASCLPEFGTKGRLEAGTTRKTGRYPPGLYLDRATVFQHNVV